MPRVYCRKTNRQSWSEEAMQHAVEAVAFPSMGARKASAEFGIPKATIERRVRLYRKGSELVFKKGLGSKRPVFTAEQEKVLVDYLQLMEARLFGLTKNDLAKLAFQLATSNNIKHPFKNGKAGEDWVAGFLARHTNNLSLRKPEATFGAWAMGFNKPVVDNFFNLYENTIEKHNLSPQQIYNYDETGVSIVPKTHSKVISTKGKRQVGVLTSSERGLTVTVEIYFSASGEYITMMFVFPRKRVKEELLEGAPPGTWAQCHISGWMQSDIFFNWFKRFVTFSRAGKDNPVLLLLDGHATHVKNLEVIDYARENNVVILCFPPHCTHKLQPADVGFMRSLSIHYSNEVKSWMLAHPGRMVSQFKIAHLLGNAFVKSAKMTTALTSFRKTGLWPVDRSVFSEEDFLASATTEIPLESSLNEINPATALCPNSPSTSRPFDAFNMSESFTVSPEDISPIPVGRRDKGRKLNRGRGKAAVITESPYKNELENQQKTPPVRQHFKSRNKKPRYDKTSSGDEIDLDLADNSGGSWKEEKEIVDDPVEEKVELTNSGYCVIKIRGENTKVTRNYIGKITNIKKSGITVHFLKKVTSKRFILTTEEAFIPQSDIVAPISNGIEHKKGRFEGSITFCVDPSHYSLY